LLARNFSSPAPTAVKIDDLGDAATEETQRTLAFVAAGATQETVFEVLEAIRRIECGTYGICEVTGEPIEEAPGSPAPNGPERRKTAVQNGSVDLPAALCQYRIMLGETKKQFSLTRAASSTYRRAESKFLSVYVGQ
jgi:hypothetical protein